MDALLITARRRFGSTPGQSLGSPISEFGNSSFAIIIGVFRRYEPAALPGRRHHTKGIELRA
jgi:hypothetical protein